VKIVERNKLRLTSEQLPSREWPKHLGVVVTDIVLFSPQVLAGLVARMTKQKLHKGHQMFLLLNRIDIGGYLRSTDTEWI
jgi:hypothetical protein